MLIKTALLMLAVNPLLAMGPVFAPPDVGVPPAPPAPAPATETQTVIKQNGIKRPEPGSITGRLWDIADRLSENAGRPATRKEVVDEYLKVPGANSATANTQYARWVAFHNVGDVLKANRKASIENARKAKDAEKAQKAIEAAKAKAEKDEAKAKAKAEAEQKAAAAKAAKDIEAAKAKAEKEAATKATAEKKANKAAA